jgi:hypothetical protein
VSAQPWVREIIEERDENVEQTVKSAASCIAEKEKKYTSPCPSKAMQEAIFKTTGRTYYQIIGGSQQTELSANSSLLTINSSLRLSKVVNLRKLKNLTIETCLFENI